MYDFTIPMAIMDYIPVLFFGMTMIILQYSLYNSMYKGSYALLAAGTINIFLAGFMKATWKLLYASGSCDFYLFNTVFLPLQSIGFTLVGSALLGMLLFKKKQDEKLAVVRVMTFFISVFVILVIISLIFALTNKNKVAVNAVRGTFFFITLMVLGLGVLSFVLSIIAIKLKKPLLIILFALTFILSLYMGYLSSKDSTSAATNWLEQSINCLSQLSLMLGTMALHKNKLSQFSFKES